MGTATVLILAALATWTTAKRCDIGPSDVIFVAHLTHLLNNDQVDDVRRFMRDITSTYEIEPKAVRVGVIVYDNSNEPSYALRIDRASTQSQVESELLRIVPAPCGFAFCKVDPSKTLVNAVLTAHGLLKRVTSANRMKKIIVIQTGRTEQGEVEYVQALQNSDPWLRVTQIHIGSDAVQSPEQAEYMQSYYQPYERYLARLRQLYPNMTLPAMQYPRREVPSTRTISNGVAVLSGFDALCSLRKDVCELVFACPPCTSQSSLVPSSNSIDTRILQKPVEKTEMEKPSDPFDSIPWPSSLPSPPPATTTTTKSPFDDAYEYEISGDPPGLSINNTPLPIKEKRDETVDFEDASDDIAFNSSKQSKRKGAFKRRSRARRVSRAVSALSQAQCTCEAAREPVAELQQPFVQQQQQPGCSQYQPPPPRYIPYFCGRSANPSPRCAQFMQRPCGAPPPCGAAPCARPCGAPACGGVVPRPCGSVRPPCAGALPPPPAPPPVPWSRPPAPEAAIVVAPVGATLPPAPAYPLLPLPNGIDGSSNNGIESTDISDWASKFSQQIEETASVKNEENNEEYEDFVLASPGSEKSDKKEEKKKSDFEKEYDYDAIVATTSPSVIKTKAQDEGWRKLLVDKRKHPRRIESEKPDALLDALSVLRPTPPSIDRLLNAFGNFDRSADHMEKFKKETVSPRTTTVLPFKRKVKKQSMYVSLESRTSIVNAEEVDEPRTTTPSASEMLRRLKKLEEVLAAEAVTEAEKETESLAMLNGAEKSRRTLQPSTLQVPQVNQRNVEREKVVKELKRLGKDEDVATLFQDDEKPIKTLPRRSCHFKGVDLVFLLDDLSSMKSVEGLHNLVESIHRETGRVEECHTRARLAILSLVSPPVSVRLVSPLGSRLCPQIPTSSCPFNETKCDHALSEGLILAVNLLTQEVNDRRKAIVVFSDRNPMASQKVSSSLSEALLLAIGLGVDVQPVQLGGTDLRPISTLAASGVAPLQWQEGQSGQLGLRNALCSQLSVSDEEIGQKQPFCPWKEENSTDLKHV